MNSLVMTWFLRPHFPLTFVMWRFCIGHVIAEIIEDKEKDSPGAVLLRGLLLIVFSFVKSLFNQNCSPGLSSSLKQNIFFSF